MFYTKTTGAEVILMDGGSVVEDNVQIRSLSHSYADLVALWSVSADRAPLSAAPSARQNARIVKGENHAKPARGHSPFAFQDIPRRKIPNAPPPTSREQLLSSPPENTKFHMPRMDDSSSPLQESGRTSGLRPQSQGTDEDEIVVVSGPPLKRKRASSPQNNAWVSNAYTISEPGYC